MFNNFTFIPMAVAYDYRVSNLQSLNEKLLIIKQLRRKRR